MKSTMTILMVLVTQLGLASNLMASTATREDGSMFLVWMFLGMCALIVIIQLMPAMFLLFGLLKSLFTGNKSPVKVNASNKE
ncbi:MAG: hypothetical protein IH613_16775 [Desulfuromonadales bacterium]|nr:hypothetical protein [Desulfuromonadales bacterium]